jgi:S-adenosylhomocysteine hydrolase
MGERLAYFPRRRKGLPTGLIANIDQGLDFVDRSIDITGQLKVLKELTTETSNADGTHSIILQHILPTTVEFIDRVNSVYPVDLVIAITYSADASTVQLLKSKGYKVLVPPDIDYMLNKLWVDVTAILQSAKYPVVLQEVGGYFADWTDEFAKFPRFKGCVEDTKNGLWRYQAAALKKPLGVPVLSMADTALKRVEDSLIGDACIYSLEKVMRSQLASILDGLRCGVVGWGNIGKSVAASLKGRNSIVSIYDINPVVNMLAFGRGYFPLPLAQLLSECDIVVGCSGRRSIRVADLNDIKDGAILCSASSKNIEFDLEGFANLCDVQDVTPAGSKACSIEKYVVKTTSKSFYILDHGTPIDFLDMPLQGAILDCTCSELFVCMRDLSTHRRDPGIVELTDDLQIAVAKKWLHIQAEAFSGELASKDKTFFFPDSWNWP